MKEFLRTVKFTLISISAGLIQAGVFAVLDSAIKLPYWISYLVALICSVLWNFTINRKYTFKSDNNLAKSMLLVALFYLVFTPVSTYLGDLATKNGVHDYIVLAVTMVSNLVLEYLFTRFIVYRNSCDTIENKNK